MSYLKTAYYKFHLYAMTDLIKKIMTGKAVHERCSKWIESQKDYPYSEDDSDLKRKLGESEYDDCYNTDSEFDSVSECGGKRRRLGIQLKNEVLDLACEWGRCVFRSKHMEQFLRHVSNHIPSIQISVRDDSEVYVCQWKDCPYETNMCDEIARHINYHTYHTKLKCIGSNVRKRVKLPVSIGMNLNCSLIKSCSRHY